MKRRKGSTSSSSAAAGAAAAFSVTTTTTTLLRFSVCVILLCSLICGCSAQYGFEEDEDEYKGRLICKNGNEEALTTYPAKYLGSLRCK